MSRAIKQKTTNLKVTDGAQCHDSKHLGKESRWILEKWYKGVIICRRPKIFENIDDIEIE